MRYLKTFFTFVIYAFAAVGFVLVVGYFAVKLGLTNTPGIIDNQRAAFFENSTTTQLWATGEEWQTFKSAVLKDQADILAAAQASGVSPRIIVGLLAAEQIRLFWSERQLFKTVFAPLKLLGNQSQFSWGVLGLKEATAETIEKNLKDPSSSFYLGKHYESALNFKTNDPDKERFERITDEKSRWYSYMYTGLFVKEVETQWKKAGFDISNRPEIIGTLFNIGFSHSEPKANPQMGGAEIGIGDITVSFGRLVAEFYYSNELKDEFPR